MILTVTDCRTKYDSENSSFCPLVVSCFRFTVLSFFRIALSLFRNALSLVCIALSLFRIALLIRTFAVYSTVLYVRTFAVPVCHFRAYRTFFVVSQFLSLALPLSHTFVISHFSETVKIRNCESIRLQINESAKQRKMRTVVRNNISAKARKCETTKVRNNDSAKQ